MITINKDQFMFIVLYLILWSIIIVGMNLVIYHVKENVRIMEIQQQSPSYVFIPCEDYIKEGYTCISCRGYIIK